MAKFCKGFSSYFVWIVMSSLSVFAQLEVSDSPLNETSTRRFEPVNSPSTVGNDKTSTTSNERSRTRSTISTSTSAPALDADNTDLTTDGQFTRPAPIMQVCSFELDDGEGHVCLKANFAMVFKIYYESKKSGEKQASITLPTKADVGGLCKDDGQAETLTLQWKEGQYELKIAFGTDYSLPNYPQWEVRKIVFTYDMSDKDHFDDPVHPDSYTVQTSKQNVFLKTPLGLSRTCATEDDITLKNEKGGKVVLEIRQLHLQPYKLINNTFSEAKRCNADLMVKNNVASVVVGLTLAIGIILVITGYAVGRKIGIIVENPRYNQME